jgi:hypothetical protein
VVLKLYDIDLGSWKLYSWTSCLNETITLVSAIKHCNVIPFRSLNVDAIIRGGLRRYTDQLGHLWNSLADYYVRSGLFERVGIGNYGGSVLVVKSGSWDSTVGIATGYRLGS